MEIIKWWKNKHFCLIILTLVLTVIISALCGQFVSFPYNLIVIIALCAICGVIVRKKAMDLIEEWTNKNE